MSTVNNRTQVTIEILDDEGPLLSTTYRIEVSAEVNHGCREGGSQTHGWTPGEGPFVESAFIIGSPWIAVGGVPVSFTGIFEARLTQKLDAKYKAGGWFKEAVNAAVLAAMGF